MERLLMMVVAFLAGYGLMALYRAMRDIVRLRRECRQLEAELDVLMEQRFAATAEAMLEYRKAVARNAAFLSGVQWPRADAKDEKN